MKFFQSLFLLGLPFLFLPTMVLSAEDSTDSTPTHPPIETHWTTLGGMQYLQNGKALTGPELKGVIDSIDDKEASALLSKSQSEETVGLMGLGGSVALSVLSLFFPNNHIHIVGLDISTPYLALAIPGTIIGIGGALLATESSTAKYASVQRYNRVTNQPDSVTWNLSPQKDGLALDLAYAF